ncbi:MAG: type III secretion system inner rod subunit SctI [Acidobacteriota bacterium]
MTLGGMESIGPILEQARRVADEAPENMKQFQQVMDQLEQTKGSGQPINIEVQVPEIKRQGIGDQVNARNMIDEKVKMAQTPEGLKKLGGELEQGYGRLNDIVKELQSGRSFSSQEILGMQAEMHNLTLQIDITTKVVSEAVSGIKQLMQQQV